MSNGLTLSTLKAAITGSAAALRSITTLQPVEGEGGKVFPATYSRGVYSYERRRIPNPAGGGETREVDCVLLNSVQSEANHAEEALLRAIERGLLHLPLIEVDFSQANQSFSQPLPNLTSLQVPHRLADAILRDSQLPDKTRFSKSTYAASWSRANLWNATPIYELCPTALVFGMWGSPDKPGGLGAKFERAFVSETIAVDVVTNREGHKREGFRIDPIGASKAVMVAAAADGGFQIAEAKAKNAVRPSEINHGNILFESTNAGVRCRFAEQTTVISLGALRKLRFPVQSKLDPTMDDAARTVLASIGLCAATLAAERGTSLRSRCHLFPVETRRWELLETPGVQPAVFHIDSRGAIDILNAAVAEAKALGLSWLEQKLVLQPTPELTELIRLSQEAMAKDSGEGESK